MKSFIALALAAVASANEQGAKFMQYITEQGKSYATVEEFEARFTQWVKMDQLITTHNAQLGRTTVLATTRCQTGLMLNTTLF